MDEEILTHCEELNRWWQSAIFSEKTKYPLSIKFQKSFTKPMFKITIEKIEYDEFIDHKGNTWKKVKQEISLEKEPDQVD